MSGASLLVLVACAALRAAAPDAWYFSDGARDVGPIPLAALADAVLDGRVEETTPVWRAGAPRRAARDVPELAATFARLPPPLPGAHPKEPPPLPGAPAKEPPPLPGAQPEEPPPLPDPAPPSAPSTPPPLTPTPLRTSASATPPPEAAPASTTTTTPTTPTTAIALGAVGGGALTLAIAFDLLSPTSANHTLDPADLVGPMAGLAGAGLLVAGVALAVTGAP